MTVIISMWLATKFGFYSIVKNEDPEFQGDFVIRAREHKDLFNLKQELEELNSRSIYSSKITDYKYRIFVSQEELSKLMIMFSESIDYSNFKDKIKSTPNQKDKLSYYSEIWGVMSDYQYRNSKSKFKPYVLYQ